MLTYKLIYLLTSRQTYMHTCLHTYILTYILTCIHTYLHTHTLTYLHKYILTSHAYLLKLLHPCILKYSYILTYMRHIPYHYILAYFYTYIISNLPARTRIFLQQYKLTYSNPYRLTYILTNLHTIWPKIAACAHMHASTRLPKSPGSKRCWRHGAKPFRY